MSISEEPEDPKNPDLKDPNPEPEPEPGESKDPEGPDLEDPEVEAPGVQGATTAPVRPVRRALNWCRERRLAVVCFAVVIGSALIAGSVYWWLYRPDQLTDAAAQQGVIAAAREGTEALLSYSPESIDADLSNAKSHLTGDFLSYYSEFTEKVVGPAARQKGVKTEANVARAAVSQMRPGRADVLVFVNQVTTSKDRPTPALSTSSVVVTLVESDGRWLISKFEPV